MVPLDVVARICYQRCYQGVSGSYSPTPQRGRFTGPGLGLLAHAGHPHVEDQAVRLAPVIGAENSSAEAKPWVRKPAERIKVGEGMPQRVVIVHDRDLRAGGLHSATVGGSAGALQSSFGRSGLPTCGRRLFSEERPSDKGMTYHVVHQDLQANQYQGHRGQAGREPNLTLVPEASSPGRSAGLCSRGGCGVDARAR